MEAAAQEQEIITTQGKFRIQLGAGQTGNFGSAIKAGGSSNVGGGIVVGYGLSPRLDVEITYGGDATYPRLGAGFSKTYCLLTLKYRIPVLKRLQLTLGAGGGYYNPGYLEFPVNDADYLLHYKKAFGTHLITELEYFLRRNLSLNVGWKYYTVSYHETFAERNGVPFYYYGNGLEKLNGNGLGLMFSVATYF